MIAIISILLIMAHIVLRYYGITIHILNRWGNYGFTILVWVAIGLLCIQSNGKTAKEESRRPLQRSPQRHGIIFWNVSESETCLTLWKTLQLSAIIIRHSHQKILLMNPYIENAQWKRI